MENVSEAALYYRRLFLTSPALPQKEYWVGLSFAAPVVLMHLRGALSVPSRLELSVIAAVMGVGVLLFHGQAHAFFYFQF